jgi:hypothetical protein
LLDELSEKQPGRLSNLEKLLGYLRRNGKNPRTKFTNRAIYYSRFLARFLRILCIVNFKKGFSSIMAAGPKDPKANVAELLTLREAAAVALKAIEQGVAKKIDDENEIH